jgi:hypothetical protein
VALALAGSGCASTVNGTAMPSSATVVHVAGDLSGLLLATSSFHTPYEAVILPGPAVSQALGDLIGDTADATVEPSDCAQDLIDLDTADAAIVVGTNNSTRSTISVALARTTGSLADQKEKFERCPDVTSTENRTTTKIHVEVTPAAPIDADESLAFKRTVTSGSGTKPLTQTSVQLWAQVGDVIVMAAHISFSNAKPDAAVLDELFTAQVLRLKKA